MASICVMTDPMTVVDYSLRDGRVRSFNLRGELLYDETSGNEVDGWEERLVAFVKEQRIDIDYGGGLPKFVHRLIERGILVRP